MVLYREIRIEELNRELFKSFQRYQVVTKCFRCVDGQWIIKDDPFIDDWTETDYQFLIQCLKQTLSHHGLVYGAFIDNQLKGFVSVEGEPIGTYHQYLDLSSLHVSKDARRHGIGQRLFNQAVQFTKTRGIEKLYISSHSALETQTFYKMMGCHEAKEYWQEHVIREPFDCQLEYEVQKITS